MSLSLSDEDKNILSRYGVVDMSNHINDFSDTAAIIEQMDLVISVDTSVVHLAGAMGKPTINLLHFVNDWRWQNNREDSPWYPTMRLYQQAWNNDWVELITRLTPTLKNMAAQFEKTGEVNLYS